MMPPPAPTPSQPPAPSFSKTIAHTSGGLAAPAPNSPCGSSSSYEILGRGLTPAKTTIGKNSSMGEDVGHYGGSYKVTKGLAMKNGDLRVLDTPITVNSFMGMGIGVAMTRTDCRRHAMVGSIFFSKSSPDDCLAFTYYRLSLEAKLIKPLAHDGEIGWSYVELDGGEIYCVFVDSFS